MFISVHIVSFLERRIKGRDKPGKYKTVQTPKGNNGINWWENLISIQSRK